MLLYVEQYNTLRLSDRPVARMIWQAQYFEILLRFLKQCNFSILHLFYSCRPYLLKSCWQRDRSFLIHINYRERSKREVFAIFHFQNGYVVLISVQLLTLQLVQPLQLSETVHSGSVILKFNIFRIFRKPNLTTISFRDR